jgi:hypothetical protein
MLTRSLTALKWFYDNGKEEPYEGGRDLDAFVSQWV